MTARRSYRVAMVVACPFPSLRGSQVLVRELAEHLAQAGHSVHVVTYPSAQHMVPIERIAIHRTPRLPGLWTDRPLGWQKIILDALLFVSLLRVVRQERIDVIHAHNFEAPLLAFLVRLLTGVRVVYHAHNALSDEMPCYFTAAVTRRLARWVGGGLDRLIARQADFSIALSDRLAAFLAMRGASGRVITVPPGVSAGLGSQNGVPRGGGPLIMYAGNLDPYQNLGCLLEGFARVSAAEPRARLVVVTQTTTDPTANRQMRDLSSLAGVSVRTVSTFASMTRQIRQADVVVCPRTSWSGFPIKILHYMALGVAIVQARGSAHAIIDGRNGLLFADDDPVSLARSVLRLLRDPGLARELGREAQLTARQNHQWGRLVALVNAAYGQVLDGGCPPRGKLRRLREAALAGRNGHVGADGERTVRYQSLLAGCVGLCLLAACASRAPDPDVAPLPPIQTVAVPAPVEWDSAYRLQVGDVVRVKFLYHPELDVKVPIGPDGRVSIQGVGELLAAGKRADELGADVTRMSSDRLRDPDVTIIVAQLAERAVYVGGEVRLPGPVPYREGMTPLQAVLDRGGFTEVARTDSVLRLTIKGNSYEATRLDLGGNVDLGSPDMTGLNVYDVIYVPRTFIGDANAFVRLYIVGLMPTVPRLSYPIGQ